MNIQILSDLHFEFHADHGKSFVSSLGPSNVDILIVAGDVSSYPNLFSSLELICKQYSFATILYVAGNHEYYHALSKNQVETVIKEIELRYHNFVWLNRSITKSKDINFVGCTLWFPDDPMNFAYSSQLNDFTYIPNFANWVYDENQKDVAFLKTALNDLRQQKTIVITHHLPTIASVAKQFRNSNLNRFFVTDLTNLILYVQPTIWVHGHTHINTDFCLDNTRIVCNPFGYVNEKSNAMFKNKLILEM